ELEGAKKPVPTGAERVSPAALGTTQEGDLRNEPNTLTEPSSSACIETTYGDKTEPVFAASDELMTIGSVVGGPPLVLVGAEGTQNGLLEVPGGSLEPMF